MREQPCTEADLPLLIRQFDNSTSPRIIRMQSETAGEVLRLGRTSAGRKITCGALQKLWYDQAS